jgi:hypothetical protein
MRSLNPTYREWGMREGVMAASHKTIKWLRWVRTLTEGTHHRTCRADSLLALDTTLFPQAVDLAVVSTAVQITSHIRGHILDGDGKST